MVAQCVYELEMVIDLGDEIGVDAAYYRGVVEDRERLVDRTQGREDGIGQRGRPMPGDVVEGVPDGARGALPPG